jgi:starch synthase
MDILHISMECYPVAKTGGLGDVVGSLPKYLSKAGVSSGVVMPMYNLPWIHNQSLEEIFSGQVRLDQWWVPFRIVGVKGDPLGFPLFLVDSHHHFYREGVYSDAQGSYGDEVERYLIFQQAVLQWICSLDINRPKVLHCHDHHTALIPFFVKYCPEFQKIALIRTVLTIHNGVYQGGFSWRQSNLLPWYQAAASGLLDWNGVINPLACGIRCCWQLTTVSQGYLEELKYESAGLEELIRQESPKAKGILNGIDFEVWNPAQDPRIQFRLQGSEWDSFKAENKKALCQYFHLNQDWPLVVFIGRLVREKGADILPDLMLRIRNAGLSLNFIVLGTGERKIEQQLRNLHPLLPTSFRAQLEYNEDLAHQLYAGADFLLMPSRVEPCGLNQMFAMRYGTLPIVRAIGGLRDSVPDIGVEGGRGIQYTHFTIEDTGNALYRAQQLYQRRDHFEQIRTRITQLDLSWEASVLEYIQIYNKLTPL